MRALHPRGPDVLPLCPEDAPHSIFDKVEVAKLVGRWQRSTAAGPSGWTAELLAPLLGNDSCLEAVTLLVQLIANDDLDEHSRHLLTCSALLGIPKSDSDQLRPLALGELFVKIATKLCFDLDARHFPAMFEPLQLGVGCPGGSERAMQSVQAALEANPAHIAIHVDSASAFNSADRAQMLAAVFAERRLHHTWRAFAFCYARPSLLLMLERGVLVDTVPSSQGGRQGCVLAGLGYANLFQAAYTACAHGRAGTTVRAVMDDLALVGPPAEVFDAYATYVELAVARGVAVNRTKTCVQQPAGAPSPETVRLALEHGLPIAATASTWAATSAWMTSKALSSWRPSWPTKALCRAPFVTLPSPPTSRCTWPRCTSCPGPCSCCARCPCASPQAPWRCSTPTCALRLLSVWSSRLPFPLRHLYPLHSRSEAAGRGFGSCG